MPTPIDRPTPDRYLDALNGFQRTEAVVSALELNLFGAIASGATGPEALARACGASARGIRILADYLVTLGLLEKRGADYALSPESALYLDPGQKAYLGEARRFLTAPMMREGFARLTQAVRSGGTALPQEGSMEPDHPVWVDYARGMAPMVRRAAERIADRLLEPGFRPREILDVAAGHGLFGIAFGSRVSEARVTALDWPGVLGAAAENAARAGLGARYRTVAGDAFTAAIAPAPDLVIVANFLHHFSPSTVAGLLARLRAALAPDGRVAIVEFVPNPDRVSPPAVAQFAVSLLATTREGDLYTEEEYARFLAGAGFSPAERFDVPRSPLTALFARR